MGSERGRRATGARVVEFPETHRQQAGQVSPAEMRQWIEKTFGRGAPGERRTHVRGEEDENT